MDPYELIEHLETIRSYFLDELSSDQVEALRFAIDYITDKEDL